MTPLKQFLSDATDVNPLGFLSVYAFIILVVVKNVIAVALKQRSISISSTFLRVLLFFGESKE